MIKVGPVQNSEIMPVRRHHVTEKVMSNGPQFVGKFGRTVYKAFFCSEDVDGAHTKRRCKCSGGDFRRSLPRGRLKSILGGISRRSAAGEGAALQKARRSISPPTGLLLASGRPSRDWPAPGRASV